MIDFEINKMVSLCLGFEVLEYQPFAECGQAGVRITGTHPITYFSPVENWACAGEIIERAKISLKYEDGFWHASSDCGGLHFSDKNPRKAAMVVFIKIKGVPDG